MRPPPFGSNGKGPSAQPVSHPAKAILFYLPPRHSWPESANWFAFSWTQNETKPSATMCALVMLEKKPEPLAMFVIVSVTKKEHGIF